MKRNKIMALALASLMSVGVLTGCKKGGFGIEFESVPVVNTNATLLTVATFDGGVGHAWLEDAARRFEKAYAEHSFEEGKKGIVIDVAYDKDNYSGTQLSEKTLNKDVYFTEGVEYYTFVQDGKVADITDVVTGSMAQFGETGTIAAKLDKSTRDYLTAGDGRYYMLPFYDGFYGFIYDVDLFEEQGYYFGDDGDTVKRAKNETQEAFDARKSNGPDGVDGTYDDGLPATYEQFIELCDIISVNCIPFCYSGNYNDYVDKAFRSFIADYEGEAFKLNYTLEGKDVELVNVDAEGNVTPFTMDINPGNAYNLKKQAGCYYALKMQETLFGSAKYIGGSYNAFDFTEAQSNFIMSKYTNGKRYAMLVEGIWWENEATDIFEELEIRGDSKESRRFGLLPIPKQSAERAGNQTMYAANSSFCFINKNCTQMAAAKEFLRFVHTDAEMSKFSSKTSIPRSLHYEVSAEDRAKATHFGKTLIDMRASATVVYPYSAQSIVLKNPASFTDSMWYLTSRINNTNINKPFSTFQDTNTTAEQYFQGLFDYQYLIWNELER